MGGGWGKGSGRRAPRDNESSLGDTDNNVDTYRDSDTKTLRGNKAKEQERWN